MAITLALKDMNLSEKFLALEMIWDDIIHNSPDFPSPEWHKDILTARDSKISSGEDKLIDWEEAKKQLRNSHK